MDDRNWIVKRAGWIIFLASLVTMALIAATIYLVLNEQTVQRIGSPCRSARQAGGIPAVQRDQECTKQADNLLINICFHHRIPACATLDKEKRRKGVVASSGNPPSSQPGPSSQGGGHGGQRGGSSPSPSTPAPSNPAPANPPSTAPTGPVGQVCHAVSDLGIPLC